MENNSRIWWAIIPLIIIIGAYFLVKNHVQAPNPIPEETSYTYENSQYKFAVDYPKNAEVIIDKEKMATVGYLPTCNIDYGTACIYFSNVKNYAGTNFGGAAVSINVRTDKKTEAECTAIDSQAPEQLPSTTLNINGINFTKYTAGDAAMSHQSSGADYRAFHSNTCFEITTRINTTTFEVYQTGTINKFTDENRSELETALSKVVSSFRFE